MNSPGPNLPARKPPGTLPTSGLRGVSARCSRLVVERHKNVRPHLPAGEGAARASAPGSPPKEYPTIRSASGGCSRKGWPPRYWPMPHGSAELPLAITDPRAERKPGARCDEPFVMRAGLPGAALRGLLLPWVPPFPAEPRQQGLRRGTCQHRKRSWIGLPPLSRRRHCLRCHGQVIIQGDLRFDEHAGPQ